MYPEDIEWLFREAPIGTPVTVVDQPVKLGWKDGELYIEVQPSTMQIDKMEETSRSPGPPDPIPLAEQADRILRVAGAGDAERLDWPMIERALTDRQGYPIRVTKPVELVPPVEVTLEPTQAAQADPAQSPGPTAFAPNGQQPPPLAVGALRPLMDSVPVGSLPPPPAPAR